MKKLAIAAAALMLTGCASIPQPKQAPQQVNRAVKADKKAPAKPQIIVAPVEHPTPNETVKKRWYDRFMKHKPK